jgi:sugar lactone lactonase YvrE
MRHYNWFLAIASLLAIGGGTAVAQTFTPVQVYGQFGQVYPEAGGGYPDILSGTCRTGQTCPSDPQQLPGSFNTPMSVAADGAGRLVVADTFNHRVQVLGPDGTHRLTIGGLGSLGMPYGEIPLIPGLPAEVTDPATDGTDPRFFYPTGVGVDAAGKIVVADNWNHRVIIYNADGTLFTVLGAYADAAGAAVDTLLGGFAYPYRVALRGGTRLGDPMDVEGRLFVLDQGNHRVQMFDAMLTPLGAFGGGNGGEAGRFFYPNDLAYDDSRHQLLVTDGNNNRIQVFSAGGAFQFEFGAGDLQTPLATAVDSYGRICVVDKLDRVRVFAHDGGVVRHLADFGSHGSAPGQFNYGGGIAYGGYGRLVVADSDNHRIQVFQEQRPEDVTAPVSTAALRLAPNSAGWVNDDQTVTFTATDEGDGVDVVVIDPVTPDGPEMRVASGTQLSFADGVHVMDYYAIDRAGNREIARRLEVRVDSVAPAITCSSNEAMIWPPNHQMVPVSFSVAVRDSLSGAHPFVLASATSNEPDNGLGDGDRPNDLQGWMIGTPDTAGLVRAERSGRGAGRVYSFRFETRDAAGNSATCAVATAAIARNGSK